MIKKGLASITKIQVFLMLVVASIFAINGTVFAVVNPQSNSNGLVGTIPSPPPTIPASIATPSNGQVFSSMPVTVSGVCPSGLLVKVYINNIFSGSAQCVNGSYSISVTLFNGSNVITVIDYDALNQAGPTSNTVTVNYNNPGGNVGASLTLTSTYAKLGANPGSQLSWPIIISGGSAPYAISVDWGDSTPTQLISQKYSGTFNITHTYAESGIYNVVIRATDADGNVAYLQLVGVANGAILQSTNSSSNSKNGSSTTAPKSKLTSTTILSIIGTVFIAIILTFWLGSRHKLHTIKTKLEKGERPF